MTTPTQAASPLPPDLLAKAAEALAACEDWNYEFPGVEARAEKLAEAALRAVNVPGLMAENEQFRVSASQLRWLGELPADERARLVKIYFGDFTKIEQERDEAQRAATLHRDEVGSLREHLDSLILENGLTASQLRARIQLLVQRPDGTPSARVRALIDANHALTQQRDEAREALAACEEPLLTLIEHPICNECLACRALEQARRVLGKETHESNTGK